MTAKKMKRKPHKKWDCPCTDCQVWYRDQLEAANARAAMLHECLRSTDQLRAQANRALESAWDEIKAERKAREEAETALHEMLESVAVEHAAAESAERENAELTKHAEAMARAASIGANMTGYSALGRASVAYEQWKAEQEQPHD